MKGRNSPGTCKPLQPRTARLDHQNKYTSKSSNREKDERVPSRDETSGSEIDYSHDSDDNSLNDLVCGPGSNPLERFLPEMNLPSCGTGESAIATPMKLNRRSTMGAEPLSWEDPLSDVHGSAYSSPPFARLREDEFRERLGRRIHSNCSPPSGQEGDPSQKPLPYQSSLWRNEGESSTGKALNNSFNSYQSPAWKIMQESLSTRDQRASRQARFGRPRSDVDFLNSVKIHVYDLLERETVMRLWNSCDCPLGRVFQAVNNGLHCLGSGAYHAGIEVNGVEYSYGYSPLEGVTGVFTNLPKRAPGHQYRTTIDFGEVKTTQKISMMVPESLLVSDDETSSILREKSNPSPSRKTSPRSVGSFLDVGVNDSSSSGKSIWGRVRGKLVEKICDVPVNGNVVMSDLAHVYMGSDYDILRCNCCHFVKGACIALGILESEIPTWFMNLAAIGVATEDAIIDFDSTIVTPIRRIFIQNINNSTYEEEVEEEGFEVIEHNRDDIVPKKESKPLDEPCVPFKRTLTWTY